MKVYAKNPAPEEFEVINNPAELVIQNPTPKQNPKKMGKSKRKRDSKGRFMSKSTRKNQSSSSATEEFVDTGKGLFMQYGLAALAATGTVKGAQYILAKMPNIPAWAKEWALIGGPAAAGILLSMYADKKSAIAQGIAGGMVLASANGLSDKLIKGGTEATQMADAALEAGDMIVKPDGILYDQQGNAIARISSDSVQTEPLMPPELESYEDSHLLGDYGAGFDVDNMSWESGEAFAA